MKRISYLFTAAILFSFAGCGSEPADSGNQEEIWNLFATGLSADTRVAIGDASDGERSLTWEEGDRLYAFDDTVSAEFTLENAATGKFTSTSGFLSNGSLYGVVTGPVVSHAGQSGASITMPEEITVTADGKHLSQNMVMIGDAKFSFQGNTATGVKMNAVSSVIDVGVQLAAGDADRKLVSLTMKAPVENYFIKTATISEDGVVSADAAANAVTLKFSPALELNASTPVTIKLPLWVNPAAAVPAGDFVFTLVDDNDFMADISKDAFAIAPGTYYNAPVIRPSDVWMLNYSLKLKWIGQTYLGDIRSVSPAVDSDGDVYMTSNPIGGMDSGNPGNSPQLIKFSGADGSVSWRYDLWNTTDFETKPAGNQLTSPAVDSDGTVYIGTGATGPARLYAINSDGTKKWVATREQFFGNGSTPNPSMNYVCPAIGDDRIYIGNQGTAGSVVAFNKTTGTKDWYVSSSADGTGGPAGGGTAGVLLTNAGKIVWGGGAYGVFTAPSGEATTAHATYGAYHQFSTRYSPATFSSGITAAMALDAEGTIYVPVDYQGKTVRAVKSDGSEKWTRILPSTGGLDQSGVVIDKNNILYVPMKESSSGAGDGGVVAISAADGTIQWHFKLNVNCTSVPAIDQDGNIHFGTDNGYYYIIRNEGTSCSVLYKADIVELIINSGSDYGTTWVERKGTIWSSPVIAADGSIYFGITNSAAGGTGPTTTQTNNCLLIGLKSANITGVQSGAPWPMKGQNMSRTNRMP